MQCPSCHSDIPSGASYCPKCGELLPEPAPAPPGPSDPADPADAPLPAPSGLSASGEADSARSRLLAAAADRMSDEAPAEKTVWTGSYSAKAMIGYFLAGSLLVILLAVAYFKFLTFSRALIALIVTFFVLEGLLWMVYLYRRLSVAYELTTQRFIHKAGLLSRTTDRIELIDIDDVTVEQGPVERIMKVGTIRITSSDRTHPELAMVGIDDVQNVARRIDDLRREERRKRGLHIENI